MKIIRNDLYEQYTKTTIGFDTDFSEITKEQLRDTFKFHCVNMRVLDDVVNYIYEAIHKDGDLKSGLKELQAEVLEANDNAAWWHNRYKAVKKQLDELKGESNE